MALEVDGEVAGRGLRFLSGTIPPGQKTVGVLSPAGGFERGKYITVRTVATNGRSAAEHVRVFSLYPITTEGGGDAPARYGLDPNSLCRNCRQVSKGSPPPRVPVNTTIGPHINHIFDCAMHTYRANLTRSAQQILLHHDICGDIYPAAPTSVHLCRIRPEEGYGKFGDLSDLLRINPLIDTGRSKGSDGEFPEETAARITRYAYAGASPRPLHSVVHTREFRSKTRALASPADVRRLAYTLVGEGVKGLFWRHQWWAGDNALNSEIEDIVHEIMSIRSLLATSDMFPVVADCPEGITAYTLLAPENGLILILVDRRESSGAAYLKLKLPAWLQPKQLLEVTRDGLNPVGELAGKGTIDVVVPLTKTSSAYLIDCKTGKASSGPKTREGQP